MPSDRTATDLPSETPLVDRILAEDHPERESARTADHLDVIDRAWQRQARDPS